MKGSLIALGVALAMATMLYAPIVEAASDYDFDVTGGTGWSLSSYVEGWYNGQNYYNPTYHEAVRWAGWTIQYWSPLVMIYQSDAYYGEVATDGSSVGVVKYVNCIWAYTKSMAWFRDWLWVTVWYAEISSYIQRV